MRVLLTISYLGTAFSGWQCQHGKDTVQARVELALAKLYGCAVKVFAAGRTDAGVHAIGQAVHFNMPKTIPMKNIVNALNFFLPPEIRIIAAQAVPDNFDARKTAHRTTYCYKFYYGKTDDPFKIGREQRLFNKPPDIEKMRQAAALMIGKHNFNALHCTGSSAKTTVRTVYECNLNFNEGGGELTITANGFLYKMVRVIMGALKAAGEYKLSLEEIRQFLLSGTDWQNKIAVAPDGLYLVKVTY